jgi:hypothetical protein
VEGSRPSSAPSIGDYLWDDLVWFAKAILALTTISGSREMKKRHLCERVALIST